MRIVVQRVKSAKVSVKDEIVSKIDKGYLLLVGFKHEDTIEQVTQCARKVANLRIFSDEEDKLNLNIKQVKGEILSVSQFTVYGSLKKTNRPSFTSAKAYNEANDLYKSFNRILKEEYDLNVYEGIFGENMLIELINDGPVTIIIDSEEL